MKACDEFIYLRAAAAGATRRAASRRRGERRRRRRRARRRRSIPEIAREAAAGILARATAPVNPSAIKAAIVRSEPDFDERDHGFSTFSRLLEAMEKEGLLRCEQGAKGQWYVMSV